MTRRALYIPFVLLALAALVWSGFWFYARHRVQAEFDLAIQREAERGRSWSCPDRAVAGFPFRIEVTCRNPSFRSQVDGQPEVTGGLALVRGLSQAYRPNHVILAFEGPLTAMVAGRTAATVTWNTARTSLRVQGGKLERLSVEVDRPQLSMQPNAWIPAFEGSADRLEWHVRPGPDGAETDRADAYLKLTRADSPLLRNVLRLPDPADFEIDLRLLKFGPLARGDWRDVLETWRLAGGTAVVETVRLAVGRTRLEASGPLALDQQRRLEGRLEASFVNADQLLRAFGVTGGAAGALLGGLLGGGQGGGQERDRTIRLPLVFQNGRLMAGPLPVARLQPLY
jgi:hypothetical protein